MTLSNPNYLPNDSLPKIIDTRTWGLSFQSALWWEATLAIASFKKLWKSRGSCLDLSHKMLLLPNQETDDTFLAYLFFAFD